ncbi:hypothetical protein LTR15_000084 [Elasticomyces elasticus]|nr:hypothetical protein LTR15_000084 [Elasticomyces elasticus]
MATTQERVEQNHATIGAAARVFAIPELLEMILLQLKNTLQLFILRRVNTTFYQMTKDSKALRYYFMVRTTCRTTWGKAITFNPALQSVEAEMDKAWYPMELQSWDNGTIRWDLEINWWTNFWANDSGALSRLADLPMCSQASWREIWLLEDWELFIELYMPNEGSECWHEIKAEEGATIGWLVDCYAAELRRQIGGVEVSTTGLFTSSTTTQDHSISERVRKHLALIVQALCPDFKSRRTRGVSVLIANA